MAVTLPSGWATLGPLTSIFTPPAECNTLTISYNEPTRATTTESDSFALPTPYVSPRLIWYDPMTAPSCFPTQYPRSDLHTATRYTVITLSSTTTGSTVYPSTTAGYFYPGYFYPGRCPLGWSTRTLEYSWIPTGHTMAECCPVLPTATPPPINAREAAVEKELEKRRGTRPSKKYLGGCLLQMPNKVYPPSATPTSIRYPDLATITALANGTLTTIAPDEWKTIADEGRGIEATAVVVMWKAGDFPDIDKANAVASASASASLAAYQQRGQSPGSISAGVKAGIAGGVTMGVLFILLIAFLMKRSAMHKRNETMTSAIMGRLKKKFVAAAVVKKSEDSLLANEGKHDSSTTTAGARRDDIENVPFQAPEKQSPAAMETPTTTIEESPPAYQPGESSTATATDSRAWNETNLEYEQRRLTERKALLLERIRLAREEDALRARMKARGP